VCRPLVSDRESRTQRTASSVSASSDTQTISCGGWRPAIRP
jgi:hypothetical protein